MNAPPATPSPSRPSRVPAVDALRLVAAAAVVLIHFWPRATSGVRGSVGIWVCGIGRFAVPFFFAASGHFLSKRLGSIRGAAGPAWKWFRIVVLWQCIHVAWFYLVDAVQGHSAPFPDWLRRNLGWNGLFEGPAWPLWYLHSLVFTLLATGILSGRLRPLAWALAAAMFSWALLAGPWHSVLPMVPWPFSFNPRGFLFTSWLPFLWGAAAPARPRAKTGMAITVAGFVVLAGEILLLPADPSFPPDFLLGGMIAGVGLFHLALAQQGRKFPFAGWAAAALPMYLTQLMLYTALRKAVKWPFAGFDPWSGQAVATVLALVPFALGCLWLSRTGVWRRIHA